MSLDFLLSLPRSIFTELRLLILSHPWANRSIYILLFAFWFLTVLPVFSMYMVSFEIPGSLVVLLPFVLLAVHAVYLRFSTWIVIVVTYVGYVVWFAGNAIPSLFSLASGAHIFAVAWSGAMAFTVFVILPSVLFALTAPARRSTQGVTATAPNSGKHDARTSA
jgi:hypothetical protein